MCLKLGSFFTGITKLSGWVFFLIDWLLSGFSSGFLVRERERERGGQGKNGRSRKKLVPIWLLRKWKKIKKKSCSKFEWDFAEFVELPTLVRNKNNAIFSVFVCSLFLPFSLQPSKGFSLRYGCGCSVLEVIETYDGEAKKKERRMMMRRRECGNAKKRLCVTVSSEVAWCPFSISKMDKRRMEVFD